MIISDAYLNKTAGEEWDFRYTINITLAVEKKIHVLPNFRVGRAREADILTQEDISIIYKVWHSQSKRDTTKYSYQVRLCSRHLHCYIQTGYMLCLMDPFSSPFECK
jgi:hypothetical protein